LLEAAKYKTVCRNQKFCLLGLRPENLRPSSLSVARAEKLACRAIEAADALGRQPFRGQQTVRVKHVYIHDGAQAVVGVVASGGRRG
jgi:hypothetical protein